MPKPIKKRITKKSVTKEDEVKSTLLHGFHFMKEKKRPALVVASVAGAILALFLVVSFYNASVKKEAYTLELQAYEYYYGTSPDGAMTEEARWKKAAELFQKSVEKRSTPAAVFYLGNCYYKLGDYESAIREYTAFTTEFGNAKEILPIVYQKLAAAYMKAGKEQEALKTLEKLSGITGRNFKDTALVIEARYYESIGRPMEELQRYREILSQFPDSPWFSEARARVDAEDAKQTGEMTENGKVGDEEISREPAKEQAETD